MSVEELSKNWNALMEYIETWYPLIKGLEQKRLEAKKHPKAATISLVVA